MVLPGPLVTATLTQKVWLWGEHLNCLRCITEPVLSCLLMFWDLDLQAVSLNSEGLTGKFKEDAIFEGIRESKHQQLLFCRFFFSLNR